MSFEITRLSAREVLDSRGNPTLECDLEISGRFLGRAMVPSGASKGENEALELRDGDPKRYGGKGVLKAVHWIQTDARKRLVGSRFESQEKLDTCLLELDPTPQKQKLGGNSLLGISAAFGKALAAAKNEPLFQAVNASMGLTSSDMRLPVPLMNILNGGVHANNGLEFQEFMIVPHGFSDFPSALRAGAEIFQCLKKELDAKGYSTAVGDEGGFAPKLESNEAALQLICSAVEKAGYRLGEQVSLALDVAASSFFDGKTYRIRLGKETATREELIAFYGKILGRYPIVSIEDGLEESDWEGWRVITQQLGKKVQLVGDDLFVTQVPFVERGIREKAANAVLIKINQVGTLTETYRAMALCRKNGFASIVSHRSGETEDTTISHLAVGSGCGQIKTGSLSRGERTAKYNELLRIGENTQIPFTKVF